MAKRIWLLFNNAKFPPAMEHKKRDFAIRVDIERTAVIWGALVQWVKALRPFGRLRMEIVRRGDQARGFKILPQRWIVERTFGWLSKSRRLCRDHEVRLDHSEAMLRLCMLRLMVKRMAPI